MAMGGKRGSRIVRDKEVFGMGRTVGSIVRCRDEPLNDPCGDCQLSVLIDHLL